MNFRLIKDFLFYVEICHQALANLYQRLSLQTHDHNVKQLLEYMKNKEHISFENLTQFVQSAPDSLLCTPLRIGFDKSFSSHCHSLKLEAELALKDVVSLVMKLNIQLIDIMQTAAFDSETIEAEVALEKLIDQEEELLYKAIIASHEFKDRELRIV